MSSRPANILPGFGLSFGYASLYMSLLVLIPLAGLGLKTSNLSWDQFRNTITNPHVMAAYKLSFSAALAAALLNGVFGTVIAWTLVRYRFPGRKFFDAIIDLPFAMPTAVAGLTFGDLYGYVPLLARTADAQPWTFEIYGLYGLDVRDWCRVTVMLTFVGLPYVIRSIQPILQDWDMETEQAAMSLGAGPATIMRRLIAPEIWPAWISGVALAFARGVGEYGSIIFIASNIPGLSQIAPQLILDRIYDPIDPEKKIAAATAIAVVMLIVSLIVLLLLNGLDYLSRRHRA
ncbi:MAG: sulfate ABC transporter permease subunit CysT [Burkholderiales bacterium]|nr:sulfate ABC transporter permease subunit CysT [Phycisphaerae bacterium]